MSKDSRTDQNEKPNVSVVPKEELIELDLVHGLFYEINRTVLMPLGYKLEVNNIGNLVMKKTDDNKGFILNKIDHRKIRACSSFANPRREERKSLTGFVIQTSDKFRHDNYGKNAQMPIAPSKMKLDILQKCINRGTFEIHKQIMLNHKEKDKWFHPHQFGLNDLREKLEECNKIFEWIGVATYALMLHEHELLQKEMKKLQEYKVKYEQDIKDMNPDITEGESND